MNEAATGSVVREQTDSRMGDRAHEDPYYIAAAAPPAGERDRVLKHGDTFAVFDHHGDIRPVGMKEQGVFHEGTRFLSCLALRFGRGEPLFLSSTVNQENAILTVDLTNPDIREGDRVTVSRGTLHLFRGIFLWQGACYQRLGLRNYGLVPIEVSFSLRFDADFADIFEVRGTRRARRGRLLPPAVGGGTVVLAYEGLDGVVRRSRLEFSPAPHRLTATEAYFTVSLAPQEEALVHLTMASEIGAELTQAPPPFEVALGRASDDLRGIRAGACDIFTSNERFNDWLNRSLADLAMMVSETPDGLYPYAGVPWFSTPFGRDGIITAMQTLWVNPNIARGVLGFLAATQADAEIPEQDAEPGKILHEMRHGEMAALREIPFGRYYGSVDATPLFVMLAGAYFERTADRQFLESIWPNVERAVRWIDDYGDRDKDGFVEYYRQTPDGLANQGWKDSHDAIFHADGSAAEGPIALCEVQGYVYAAKQGAAALATALGHSGRAEEWRRQADNLRDRFERAFWCDDLSTYALALDGGKRVCHVRASNAGHALFTGIASSERAARVGQTLLSDSSFSGWGVRTVAAGEARYNPMSYHNGSVWPHDNSIIAAGLARYRAKEGVLKILAGSFDASLFVELARMPELFCGFHRRPGGGPTAYPVACSPQAWAAAAPFFLLQTMLGLRADASARRLELIRPTLPEWLTKLTISGLPVGDDSVDLLVHRWRGRTSAELLGRRGSIDVVIHA
jgi:glycogen debranching enzyme